jgi:ribosomal protein L37AE/L43A
MKTDYYCEKCESHLTERALPNINKLHKCGQLLRIIAHDPRDEEEEEESLKPGT